MALSHGNTLKQLEPILEDVRKGADGAGIQE